MAQDLTPAQITEALIKTFRLVDSLDITGQINAKLPRGYAVKAFVTSGGRFTPTLMLRMSTVGNVKKGELYIKIEYDEQGPFVTISIPTSMDFAVFPSEVFVVVEPIVNGKQQPVLDKYFVMDSPTQVSLIVDGKVVIRLDATTIVP